jgi:superfamily II DNA or RNA helicase
MLGDLATDPARRNKAAPAFVPHLELVNETVLIDRGADFCSEFEEVLAPVLRLSFDYDGVRVRAADERIEIEGIPRDLSGERIARALLESFGPIEVDELGECAQIPGCEADYVVDLESDPDSVCHFGAVAVPRLREAGWVVIVADDYEFRLVENVKWNASLEADEDAPGWFDLQLGVEIDGQVVDLLPALLDILDSRAHSLASLSYRQRSTALPLGDGRYLAIEPDRLQGILTVLNELYENSSGGSHQAVRFHEMSPLHLEGLEDAVGGNNIVWTLGVDDRDRARELARGQLDQPAPEPERLLATLRPYQSEGLQWMQTLRMHGAGGIMADDMGLGKTLQTIAHICAEHEARRLHRPCLVIAPTSLVGNWQRELKKFAPHLRVIAFHGPHRHQRRNLLPRANVVLTSYPILIRDLELFMQHEWHLLALDEAQAIKNSRSQAHAACSALDANSRLCLSGTPVENNLGELRALFDFLMPGFFGDAESFRRHYRVPIEKLGDEERLAALRRKISPFVIRRLKSQVASELPPKTHIVHSVDLSGQQRDLYEGIRMAAHATVRKVVDKKGFAASTVDILSALLKLRQVCCDPRLLGMESAVGIEQSAKTEALFELLEEMLPQGRKVLIFSQFARMLGLVGDELRARGISHATLTGQTKDRQAQVDAFQGGDVDVFLISLKAGGTGLNLTRADTVIHFDPWWNPAAQAQATDRAYRIGQKNPVFVYQLVVGGSVEERMLGLQARKQALADGLLDSGSAGGALSAEDIDELLAPLDEDG